MRINMLNCGGMETTHLDQHGLVLTCPNCGQRNRLSYERLGQSFRCGKCGGELRPPGRPVEVRTEAEFESLIGAAAVPVLVDFWAPWCGPCKVVAPELEKVAAQGQGRWVIAKVNTEEVPALAQRFGIAAIPTLVLFEYGKEIRRRSGALPAAQILHFLQQQR
jgi:thioredoxin 2